VKSDGGDERSTERGLVTARYETLRMAALGEALPPEARSGLMLFLRRGMWGWARAVDETSAATPMRSTAPSSPPPTATHKSRTVIQIFATMAIDAARADCRGAT
jgi:hypothetical protein